MGWSHWLGYDDPAASELILLKHYQEGLYFYPTFQVAMEKYFTFRSTEKKGKCIISEEISNKAQGSTVLFRVSAF